MGGGGSSNTVTQQELAPEQRELLQSVIPVAKNFVRNPPRQYQGTSIAGFNPLQRQAQQMVLNSAGGIGNTIQGAIGGMGGAINRTQGSNQAAGQTVNAAQGQMGNVNAQIQPGQQMLGQATNALGGTARAANTHMGNVQSQLNPGQNFATNNANETQRQINTQIHSGRQATAGAFDFLTGGAVLDPNQNAALRAATQSAIDPLIQNFQNTILPGIGTEAISAGGYGGTRQGIAEGLAAQGLTRNIGDITANMYSNAYGQGLNAMTQGLNTQVGQQNNAMNAALGAGGIQQQAAGQLLESALGGMAARNAYNQTAQQGYGMQQQGAESLLNSEFQAMAAKNAFNNTAQSGIALQQQGLGQMMQGYQAMPGLAQQGLLPAQLVSSVGEQQQALEQARLTEQVQKFVNKQMIPFAAAQDVAALAFGMPAGQTTSSTSGGSQSSFLPALQTGVGVMSALPALFGLFSDRRVKENIKSIGKLSDGLRVYEFTYLDGKITHTGLMADEVQKLYPDAVGFDIVAGVQTVYYHLVPTWKEEELDVLAA